MKFLHLSKHHQQNSKRGGMLILVLIIFAVSLILISSAISITLATRSRYYLDAESSQERLTLTCAAEAVIDAIETQELPDSRLEKAADLKKVLTITGAQNVALGTTSTTATNGHEIAPGLANTTNSKTQCQVSRVTGSKDIYLDFSTIIDATGKDQSAEKLRVRLKYTPPTEPLKICNNIVTMGETGSVNNVPKLRVGTENSYTVFHGRANLSNASGATLNNTVVCTGPVEGGSGCVYNADVIFYGPKAGIVGGANGNGVQAYDGYMFFLGTTYGGSSDTQNAFVKQDGSAGTSGSMNVRSKGAYFYNSNCVIDNQCMGSGDTPYVVVGSNSTFSATKVNSGLNTKAFKDGGSFGTTYDINIIDPATLSDSDADKTAYQTIHDKAMNYISDAQLKKAAEQELLPMADAKTQFAGYLSGGQTIPTSVAAGTKYEGGKHYTMSGVYGRTTYGSDSGYIEFDLTKGDVVIYIGENDSVTFTGGLYIKVTNANDHQLVFALDEGAELIFGNCCGCMGYNNGSRGVLGPCGLISCPDHNYDWSTYTQTPSWWSSTGVPSERGAGRNNIAKPGQMPKAYIIGVGKNYVEFNRASVVDAFVSLHGTGSEASTINVGDCPQFYGRMEAVYIEQGGSDDIVMLDCPAPGNDDNNDQPLTSSYTAVDYQYYYGTL